MRPIGKQRLAQRHEVPTTPILWKVKRRGRATLSRLVLAEAAVVEVSVMGAAIVAPDRWEAPVGSRVEVYWEGMSALVVVRRSAPYAGSSSLILYGVEYCDARSALGPALYERLVLDAPTPPGPGMPPPVVWNEPARLDPTGPTTSASADA